MAATMDAASGVLIRHRCRGWCRSSWSVSSRCWDGSRCSAGARAPRPPPSVTKERRRPRRVPRDRSLRLLQHVSLGGGVSWVVTGLNDGYLVHPTDEDAYGLYAYWSPEAGLTGIPALPQSSRFLAAGGRTALFASPGPMIIALDITTGTRRDIEVAGRGAANVDHACISPDGRHAILSDSTGTATIIDITTQSITATLQAAVDGRSLGWTSNTQAILLNTDRSGVLAFNLTTREATAIAEVNPDTNYWIGGSASQC